MLNQMNSVNGGEHSRNSPESQLNPLTIGATHLLKNQSRHTEAKHFHFPQLQIVEDFKKVSCCLFNNVCFLFLVL